MRYRYVPDAVTSESTRNLVDYLTATRCMIGLTQHELANELLVSRATVARWETRQTLPAVPQLLEWMRVLGVNLLAFAATPAGRHTYIDATTSPEALHAALDEWTGVQHPWRTPERPAGRYAPVDLLLDRAAAYRAERDRDRDPPAAPTPPT